MTITIAGHDHQIAADLDHHAASYRWLGPVPACPACGDALLDYSEERDGSAPVDRRYMANPQIVCEGCGWRGETS